MLAHVLCAGFLLTHPAFGDLTTIPGAKKKKKDETVYVPEAKPVNARFISGIPVEIVLDAATSRTGPVSFVIREQPQHGTLSAIRPHPKETFKALVTYTPHPGDTTLVDRFTYACKLGEGSWSAPSPVHLLGRRADPKVEVIQPPSFGRVLPGFESSSKMILKNTGIAPFAADVQWQPPWLGPPRIELAIGEQKEFLVNVKPTAPGTLIWETELQHGQPLSKVRLYVECTQLFVVAPGLLKLSYDPVTGSRRGKVGVANATELPMRFTIEPPPRMKVAKEIEVAPKQSLDVEISLSPDDVNVFRGELWIINEPYRERVLVDAAPEPAQAVLAEPATGVVDFGSILKGKTARSKVTLRNIGGEPAVMAAQVAPPFRVMESDAAVSIAPGESREMTVEAGSGQAGKYTGDIVFSGTGGKLSIAARLTVTDPNTPQSIRPMATQSARSARVPVAKATGGAPAASPPKSQPAPGPKAADGKEEEKQPPPGKEEGGAEPEPKLPKLGQNVSLALGYIATYGLPILKSMMNPDLKKVGDIELVRQGRDHLVLAWKDSEPRPERYLLEEGYNVLNQPTQRWLKAWREMPKVEAQKGRAGSHTVRINGLRPDSRYEMRVLAMDADGKVSEPSDIIFVSTAPPFKLPAWTWQALVVVALGIFGYVYLNIRRGRWEL